MQNTAKWNEAESLQLIRSMIESTKYQIAENRFLYFLWGYATLACASIHYFLDYVLGSSQAYYIWLAMPLISIVHFIHLKKTYSDSKVTTYAGRVLNGIWTGMFLGVVVMITAAFKVGWEVVYPVFMLLYGIASFGTGKALRFRFLTYGGIGSMLCAVFAFYIPFQYQLLLLMVAIVISYILPAHLMKAKTS